MISKSVLRHLTEIFQQYQNRSQSFIFCLTEKKLITNLLLKKLFSLLFKKWKVMEKNVVIVSASNLTETSFKIESISPPFKFCR